MVPKVGETAGAFVIDCKAAGKLVRLGAALAAPLHAAVTTDRHDAALFAAEHAAGQSEIHDRLHVVHAELVLGQAHAVDEYGATGMTVKQGKPLHFLARQPGAFLQHLPGLRCRAQP